MIMLARNTGVCSSKEKEARGGEGEEEEGEAGTDWCLKGVQEREKRIQREVVVCSGADPSTLAESPRTANVLSPSNLISAHAYILPSPGQSLSK